MGHLMILAAVTMLVMSLDTSIRISIVCLMLLNALCLVANSILAERHPDNFSDEPGVRLGFTGTVLLVTAALFLLLRFIHLGVGGGVWNLPLLLSGVIVGVTLRAPSMILAFWSIRLVGALNYTAAVAFLPLLGMAFEQLFVAAGLFEVSRFRMETFYLGVVVSVGILVVLTARMSTKPSKAFPLASCSSNGMKLAARGPTTSKPDVPGGLLTQRLVKLSGREIGVGD
jgi:hypothetical protein